MSYNTKGLILGVFVAFIVFLFRERAFIRNFVLGFINKKENEEMLRKLKRAMKDEGMTYEEARKQVVDETVIEEVVKMLRISKAHLQLRRDLVLYQGDKVSFVDKEVGYLQGDFIGVIESEIVGYDDLYVLRDRRTSAIRQASISYIKVDTVNVYK